MVVMAVAFVGWLVFDVGMDVTGSRVAPTRQTIARVNGENIDYITYQTALQNARQSTPGRAITLEDEQALGDQVLDQLVQEVLLNEELKRRGLKVTDEEIIAAAQNSVPPELENQPEFQTDGRFDMNKYRRYLSTNPREFQMALETRFRTAIPQNKLMQELASSVYVPTAKLWRMYQDQHDSVTATFALLQPEQYIADSAVKMSDADLQAYYNSHRNDFKRPAVAHLSFVIQPRIPDAKDSAVARDSIQGVRRELARGAKFEDVAKRVSMDSMSAVNGGDLGEVAERSMLPVFEQAALALKPGQVSQPVLSQFGWHIIKLDARDAKKKTYHARHILIPVELTGAHRDEVESRTDTLDRFAAEQTNRTALDSVAAKLGLVVRQAPPLTEGNRMQLGRFVVPDVHIWSFTRNPGETSPVIETEQAYYVFRLDSLEPQGVPSLAKVQGEVRQALTREKKLEAARTLAQQMAKELQGGMKLKALGDRLRVPVTTFGPFTRGNPPIQISDAFPVIGAAFGLGVGQVGGPYETNSGIYFVEPVLKKLADSTKFAKQVDTLRIQVLQVARRDRVQQVLASIREDAKVDDRRKELEREQRVAEERAAAQAPQGQGL